MPYDVMLRTCAPWVVRRSGIAAPWQAGSRLRLFLGARYPPFGGLILRIAPAAVASGWAVLMGRPDMGRRTTSGEGRGAAQETEARRRHPSCLTVVLPRDRVWGRVMALPSYRGRRLDPGVD